MIEAITNFVLEHCTKENLAYLMAICTAITMHLPTKLKGDSKGVKLYNFVSIFINALAGNILKNKNKDHK